MNHGNERLDNFSNENLVLAQFMKIIRDTTDAFRGLSENYSQMALNYSQRTDEVLKVANSNAHKHEKIIESLERVIKFHEDHRDELFDAPKDSLAILKKFENELVTIKATQEKTSNEITKLIQDTSNMKSDLDVASSWVKLKIPIFVTFMLCFASVLGYFSTIREVKEKYEPLVAQMLETDKKLAKQIEQNSQILKDFNVIKENGEMILKQKQK